LYEDPASYLLLQTIFEQYAANYAGKAVFAQINANELYYLGLMSQVEEYPALVIIQNREEIGRQEGIKDQAIFKEALDRYLLSPIVQGKS
jgi:hypothetical protein